MEAKYYTTAQVAELLQISKDAVYRAIDRGELRATKVASRLRVSEAALDEWTEGNVVKGRVA